MSMRIIKFLVVFLVMGGAASAYYLKDQVSENGWFGPSDPQEVRYDVDLSKKSQYFSQAPSN